MSPHLTATARTILSQLAAGHSIDQILSSNLDLRYTDIADAARQALELDGPAEPNRLQQIRGRYTHAYEPWTREQLRQLLELHEAGKSIQEIAAELRRQPSAIRSRLDRVLE